MKTKNQPYKSIPVFSSPLLEKYSHVHPAAPFLVWSPVVVYVSYQSLRINQMSGSLFLFFLFVGVMTWTLSEYLLHRFFFHLKDRGPISRKTQFVIHGFHHDDANDPTRLVMTPIVSIVVASLYYLMFRLSLGPVLAQPYFVGFLVGYLCYDYIHYYVHFFTPTTRLGKFLKSHHMKHHYAGSESRWGVSSPLWDYVFGTLKRVDTKTQESTEITREVFSSHSNA